MSWRNFGSHHHLSRIPTSVPSITDFSIGETFTYSSTRKTGLMALSIGAGSLPIATIEHQRDGSVIHQFDLHVRGKYAGFHNSALRSQIRRHLIIERLG